MDGQLIDFIKNSRNNGQADAEIKSTLLSKGWKEADILNALQAAGISKAPLNPVSQSVQQPTNLPTPSGAGFSPSPLRMLVLVGAILLNILILGGGVYAYSKYGSSLSSKTGKSSTKSKKGVIDCGKNNPGDEASTKNVLECMEPMFKDCKPAKAVASIDMSMLGAGIIEYGYEIQGPDGNMCKMAVKLISGPDTKNNGKEMICSYDNTKSFEETSMTAMKEENKCSGSLWDAQRVGS